MSDAERTIKLDLREVPRSITKRPVLVILQGQSIGETNNLEKERTIIGRGSTADVVLRDEIASRQHAEIKRLSLEGSLVEYYVNDLDSTNGTFLNGAKVMSQQLLQDGDKIKIGSHTIRDVGHIIRDVVGNADLAARYGGEEYMAYIVGSRERGFELAEQIRTKVEAHPFPASTSDLNQTMHITISLGVATFPDDGTTALEIVQKADQALFRAKLSGRNKSCVYDHDVDKPDAFHQPVDASAIIYGPADAQ